MEVGGFGSEQYARLFESRRYARLIGEVTPLVGVIEKAMGATERAMEQVKDMVGPDMSKTLEHLRDAAESLDAAIGSVESDMCRYSRLGELVDGYSDSCDP